MAVTFRTPGRHGYAVKFSPYFGQRVLCATSQHYGIAGNGTLFILDILPTGVQVIGRWEWGEGLFDCSWSEHNQDFSITASGDGSLQMWDIKNPKGPIKVLKEHTAEVYGVDWSCSRQIDQFLSASWDHSIKLWDPNQAQSLATFTDHQHVVYSAVWSPHVARTFASASGDNTVRIWDISAPPHAQQTIRAHDGEVLTCDWAKYDVNLIVTGSVDTRIRGWDLRNMAAPVFSLEGHQYAVRRVKCSPHNSSLLASCSYDFTVRTWNIASGPHPLETIEHHTEFVVGLDFNLHLPGQLADCSWDEHVKIHSPASLLQR
ncbi:peroxisomal targeting signal 2 receptor-like isoform X3 [Oculina patagonica]